jgi:hypothetical protein
MPSRMALVESQISAATPSRPISRKRVSSVGALVKGCSSSFQSPVCSTVPSGVVMATAFGSGIECDMAISSTSKGPMLRRPPIGTTSSGKSSTFTFISPNFERSISAVKGVA